MARSGVGRAAAWLANRGARRASPVALILFLSLMVGLAGCGSPSLKIEFVDSAEEFVAQAQSGSLHTVDGLALVRVSGTPYERGQQCGLLLKRRDSRNAGVPDLDHLTSEEIGFLQDHSVVLVVSPGSGIPHASLTFAGMTSVLTGVNREGLVMAFNALMGADRLSVGSPLTFFGREVLSGSATRAEAQSCFKETQVLGGVIAVLSDRTGGTVVEVMPRGAGEPRLRFFCEAVNGWVAGEADQQFGPSCSTSSIGTNTNQRVHPTPCS